MIVFLSSQQGYDVSGQRCSATFSTQDHLKRHEATVHGAPSFSCNKCLKYFNRKDSLTRHMKKSCRGILETRKSSPMGETLRGKRKTGEVGQKNDSGAGVVEKKARKSEIVESRKTSPIDETLRGKRKTGEVGQKNASGEGVEKKLGNRLNMSILI